MCGRVLTFVVRRLCNAREREAVEARGCEPVVRDRGGCGDRRRGGVCGMVAAAARSLRAVGPDRARGAPRHRGRGARLPARVRRSARREARQDGRPAPRSTSTAPPRCRRSTTSSTARATASPIWTSASALSATGSIASKAAPRKRGRWSKSSPTKRSRSRRQIDARASETGAPVRQSAGSSAAASDVPGHPTEVPIESYPPAHRLTAAPAQRRTATHRRTMEQPCPTRSNPC